MLDKYVKHLIDVVKHVPRIGEVDFSASDYAAAHKADKASPRWGVVYGGCSACVAGSLV